MSNGNSRINCATPGCPNTVLPATAQANSGYCAPCVQKRSREEERKYIAANKRVVDLCAGFTDPVDMICAIQKPRTFDRLIEYAAPPEPIESLYARLTVEEARRLAQIAADSLKSGDEHFADTLATSLATLTDHNLDPLLHVMITKKQFRPPIVFRDACVEIRDAVIASIDSGNAHGDHALPALAWIGDEVVQQQFRVWDSRDADWRSGLFKKPSAYAREAGWELTARGRRDLFHKRCLAIDRRSTDDPTDSSIEIAEETSRRCPWCNQKLIHLINIDLTDDRFSFLKVKARALPVVTCHVCTCYTVIFGDVTSEGVAHWADYNVRPKYLPADSDTWSPIPWRGTPVKLRERRAIEAAYWCNSPAASQVGGFPTWIQNDAFPDCPCCKRTMLFVAQIDQSAFDGYEGIYYAFLCAECRMTATTYQQS